MTSYYNIINFILKNSFRFIIICLKKTYIFEMTTSRTYTTLRAVSMFLFFFKNQLHPKKYWRYKIPCAQPQSITKKNMDTIFVTGALSTQTYIK